MISSALNSIQQQARDGEERLAKEGKNCMSKLFARADSTKTLYNITKLFPQITHDTIPSCINSASFPISSSLHFLLLSSKHFHQIHHEPKLTSHTRPSTRNHPPNRTPNPHLPIIRKCFPISSEPNPCRKQYRISKIIRGICENSCQE